MLRFHVQHKHTFGLSAFMTYGRIFDLSLKRDLRARTTARVLDWYLLSACVRFSVGLRYFHGRDVEFSSITCIRKLQIPGAIKSD